MSVADPVSAVYQSKDRSNSRFALKLNSISRRQGLMLVIVGESVLTDYIKSEKFVVFAQFNLEQNLILECRLHMRIITN